MQKNYSNTNPVPTNPSHQVSGTWGTWEPPPIHPSKAPPIQTTQFGWTNEQAGIWRERGYGRNPSAPFLISNLVKVHQTGASSTVSLLVGFPDLVVTASQSPKPLIQTTHPGANTTPKPRIQTTHLMVVPLTQRWFPLSNRGAAGRIAREALGRAARTRVHYRRVGQAAAAAAQAIVHQRQRAANGLALVGVREKPREEFADVGTCGNMAVRNA